LMIHRVTIQKPTHGHLPGTRRVAATYEEVARDVMARISGHGKVYLPPDTPLGKDYLILDQDTGKQYRVTGDPADAGGLGHHIEATVELYKGP